MERKNRGGGEGGRDIEHYPQSVYQTQLKGGKTVAAGQRRGSVENPNLQQSDPPKLRTIPLERDSRRHAIWMVPSIALS